jgi:hypothetical protein
MWKINAYRAGTVHIERPRNHSVDTVFNLLALLVFEQDGLVKISISDVTKDTAKQAKLDKVLLRYIYKSKKSVLGA